MTYLLTPELWDWFPEHTAAAGDVVLTEGDSGESTLILTSGELRIEADGAPVAHLIEPGSIVGEMAALLDGVRTATVRAVTDVTYRRVDDLRGHCLAQPEVALGLARVLAHRLHVLDRYLVDIRRQYGDRDDGLGLIDEVLTALSTSTAPAVEPGSERGDGYDG